MITKEMMKKYYNLTIEEITSIIEENNNKLNEISDADDGNSWEVYREKCQPYWDDNDALYSVKALKKTPEMRPFSDLDRKCLMTINEFKSYCKCGGIMDSDGFGYYATDKEVSNIEASPSAFVKGIIREDFTHVCWYNK